MTRLWQLRKSLTVQLSIVSLAFIGLVATQLIIWPFFFGQFRVSSDYTLSRLYGEFYRIGQQTGSDLTELSRSKLVEKIASKNPRFHFLVSTESGTFRFGPVPSASIDFDYTDLLKNTHYELARDDNDQPLEKCQYHSRAYVYLEHDGVRSQAQVSNCPYGLQYSVIGGIDTEVFSSFDAAWYYLSGFGFRAWRNYLIIAGGVLLIGLFTVFRSAASVRKIARLTTTIEPSQNNQKIDGTGLPLEVFPLVEALNNMLVRVDESRARERFFVSTAAHELRTPLTILRTRLESLPNDSKRCALQSDVDRLSRLVEQLLQLAKVRRFELDDGDTQRLATLAIEVCAERAPYALARHIDLELINCASHGCIVGNAALIKVAIANLIDNAISMSQADRKICIILSDPAVIQVRDFGPGVDAHKRSTIFEPFAKFPPNRNGHGLGLAIVQAIMQLHGGCARVLDPEDGGEGAVFELSFPTSRRC